MTANKLGKSDFTSWLIGRGGSLPLVRWGYDHTMIALMFANDALDNVLSQLQVLDQEVTRRGEECYQRGLEIANLERDHNAAREEVTRAAEYIADNARALEVARRKAQTQECVEPGCSEKAPPYCARHRGDWNGVPPSEPPAPERIMAAAIREGRNVFTGPHHAAIIHYVSRCAGIKPVKGEQGFVTDAGRFVGRAEAVGIAVAAGQVDPEHCSNLGLMSENLWIVPEAAPPSEPLCVCGQPKERHVHPTDYNPPPSEPPADEVTIFSSAREIRKAIKANEAAPPAAVPPEPPVDCNENHQHSIIKCTKTSEPGPIRSITCDPCGKSFTLEEYQATHGDGMAHR